MLAVLNRRRPNREPDEERWGAVALLQGGLAEMLAAADVAEKAASVRAEEIRGMCPQHLTVIALFGDVASVEAAINAVRNRTREVGA